MDETSQYIILIYDMSFKTLLKTKPLCIWFDKVDESIRIYDGTRYLVLFRLEKYNTIYSMICFFSLLREN